MQGGGSIFSHGLGWGFLYVWKYTAYGEEERALVLNLFLVLPEAVQLTTVES